jgi:hypothetical protein
MVVSESQILGFSVFRIVGKYKVLRYDIRGFGKSRCLIQPKLTETQMI